ncbi:MAG TPA: UDP-N-acetylglucosamine--N-acetylmuramyl-(pentapeptide) pyrophosphoryl-undecaprenol N-acetylglucosamine transferase [Candidatus Saccharimonadales bacterium]
MRILTVGGGSGGHVTPVVAVVRELKKRNPQAEIQFWCDRSFGSQARRLMSAADSSIRVRTIASGKLRRYHGVSVWSHLLDVSTIAKNLVDSFKIVVGFLQSFVRLIVWRPDVIFTKGGFVCLPVGVAAHVLRIPLVIHDSDALPGLTNRVLARFADVILTGAPLENYKYPPAKTTYVGIPVDAAFRPYTVAEKAQAKQRLGFPADKPLIVVTGGGLGARRINNAVAAIADRLLAAASVLHISGAGQYDALRQRIPKHAQYRLESFVSEGMADIFGAADVVITRAGASSLQELAASAAPTILVPNPLLTGGHQLKNAAVYERAKAAIVMDEEAMAKDADVLLKAITSLLEESKAREAIGAALHKFARPNAAKEVADAIMNIVKK